MIARLGSRPGSLPAARQASGPEAVAIAPTAPRAPAVKELVGVDVFVHVAGADPAVLAGRMQAAQNGTFELAMITNRGVKVWPQGLPETALSDHWRCRYLAAPGKQLNKAMIAELQLRLARAGVDFVKTEHLCTFDGVAGYSLGQGQ